MVKATRRLAGVFLIVFLSVFVPRMAWEGIDALLLDEASSLPEGLRLLRFYAAVVGVAAAVAASVATVLAALADLWRRERREAYRLTALVGGLVLSGGSFYTRRLPVFDWQFSTLGQVGALMLNWAVVCLVVLLATRLALGAWPRLTRAGG